MSSFEPMEIRDTVGQTGQARPISTPWARNAACISFAALVFQSTMTMLASLGPIVFKLRLVRNSTVMARFSFNVLTRCIIVALSPRLAVAQATDGTGSMFDK